MVYFLHRRLKNHNIFIGHFLSTFLEILWKFSANKVQNFLLLIFEFSIKKQAESLVKFSGIDLVSVCQPMKVFCAVVFETWLLSQSSRIENRIWFSSLLSFVPWNIKYYLKKPTLKGKQMVDHAFLVWSYFEKWNHSNY